MKRPGQVVLASAAVVALAIVFCAFAQPQDAQAASYKANMGTGAKLKVGGSAFETISYQDSRGWYVCKIVMTKGGSEKTLAYGTESEFVTNGKYLFYSKVTGLADSAAYEYKTTIYRMKISDGTEKKLVSGANWVARASSGTWLYCGKNYGADGVNLYALNVKTKKKRHMVNHTGTVIYKSGHVVTRANTGDLSNAPMHVFKKNGTGKKKIAEGLGISIRGKKINYVRCKYVSTGVRFKAYSCTFKVKKKKALTGWIKKYPAKYVS